MAPERFAQEESTGEGEPAAEADQEARLLELYTHAQQGHIAALRHKVGPNVLIRTIHGVGYRLLADQPELIG